jgi:hypothetical protein
MAAEYALIVVQAPAIHQSRFSSIIVRKLVCELRIEGH